MPDTPHKVVLSHRTTVALLVVLVVFFLLCLSAGTAAAQEVTSGSVDSEQTVLRESTSGGSSNKLLTPGVKVGGGEAVAGDAYAGNGCARTGGVTAGDCDEKGSGGSGAGPSNNTGQAEDEEEAAELENTVPENTLLEDTSGGETTHSGSPAPPGRRLCPVGPPKDAIEATIEDATDGDTVKLAEEVDGYDTVRQIGVDTPELEGEDGEPEPLAEEASDFAAEELEGQEVLLQVGEEEADEYGRLLAYVWTAPEDGVIGGLKRTVGMGQAELFNRRLLEKGHAEVLTIEPNDLYAGCFEAAERDAREAGVGIWDEPSDAPAEKQYDEQTVPQATTQALPPDAGPVENAPVENAPTWETPERTAAPQEGVVRETSQQQESPVGAQHERTPPSEPEVREPEIREPETQESVAPSDGDESAALETPASVDTGASPAASASPEPAAAPSVETPSTASVSVLPETGGPSVLAMGASLAAACLLAGATAGFLAVRSSLKRDHAGDR